MNLSSSKKFSLPICTILSLSSVSTSITNSDPDFLKKGSTSSNLAVEEIYTSSFAKSLSKSEKTSFDNDLVSYRREANEIKIMPTMNLNEDIKSFLDADSIERFNLFASYREGWDSGKGKTLSPMSVAMLNTFVHMSVKKGKKTSTSPSIFMTHDGCLQLMWEDKNNCTIDLEFTEQGLEYYFEASEKEGIILSSSESSFLSNIEDILASEII